jgi:hypothetical protein
MYCKASRAVAHSLARQIDSRASTIYLRRFAASFAS